VTFLDRFLYAVCLAIIGWACLTYSVAIIPELLYRTGLLPISALPPNLVDVLATISPLQNLFFYSGYACLVAGNIALLGRHRFALFFLIAAGILERLDWALLPQAGQVSSDWTGYIDLVLFLVATALLIALRHRGVLR
jgi:hypothetical protein